jgi:hypothetical protein
MLREGPERADVRVIELAAPLFQPVLELDRVVEMETVEQGTRVRLDDGRDIVRRHGHAKLVKVAARGGTG